MQSKIRLKKPEVTVAIIEELIRRDAIRPAIAGRDEKSLDTLLRFLARLVYIDLVPSVTAVERLRERRGANCYWPLLMFNLS